jgi:hypothetical protein
MVHKVCGCYLVHFCMFSNFYQLDLHKDICVALAILRWRISKNWISHMEKLQYHKSVHLRHVYLTLCFMFSLPICQRQPIGHYNWIRVFYNKCKPTSHKDTMWVPPTHEHELYTFVTCDGAWHVSTCSLVAPMNILLAFSTGVCKGKNIRFNPTYMEYRCLVMS